MEINRHGTPQAILRGNAQLTRGGQPGRSEDITSDLCLGCARGPVSGCGTCWLVEVGRDANNTPGAPGRCAEYVGRPAGRSLRAAGLRHKNPQRRTLTFFNPRAFPLNGLPAYPRFLVPCPRTNIVYILAWDPFTTDSTLIAVTSDGRMLQRLVITLNTSEMESVKIDPSGSYLVITIRTTVYVCSTSTGAVVNTGHTTGDNVRHGKRFVIVGFPGDDLDNSVTVAKWPRFGIQALAVDNHRCILWMRQHLGWVYGPKCYRKICVIIISDGGPRHLWYDTDHGLMLKYVCKGKNVIHNKDICVQIFLR